ncbi:hypothetical protein [Candidatus Tisiphia endosymbiont of Nemotelus uliginosus]
MSDVGVKALAASGYLRNLTKLVLYYHDITDEGQRL